MCEPFVCECQGPQFAVSWQRSCGSDPGHCSSAAAEDVVSLYTIRRDVKTAIRCYQDVLEIFGGDFTSGLGELLS